MMVQLQIPLANRSVQEESWKVKLAEKLTGRKLGDFGEPEDIAETAAFLASSRYCMGRHSNFGKDNRISCFRARYMTGSCIDVNGGLL